MTILFVDDEPLVIQDIFQHLDVKKLCVDRMLKAGSASEAKSVLGQEPVDIIVCDIEMPRISGIDLLTWVREHYPATESIIITSYSIFRYAQDAVRLGCIDYLLKPIVIDELESAIHRAIKEHNITASESSGCVLSTTVRRAKMFIEDSLTYESLSRTEVASHVFMNPDYLDRRFKAELGVSITQFITQLKIQVARHLLTHTDTSISEIAVTVGYPNLSNFSFMYKQATGESPRAYRQRLLRKTFPAKDIPAGLSTDSSEIPPTPSKIEDE
jgi:YesN/AraC family two-component response regulator